MEKYIDMGKAIRESSIGTRLRKSFKLWMFICQPSKRIILIRVCGRCQIGRTDRKHRTDLEKSHGRSWPWRTNIISWPCIFGLHSKRVSNQQGYCWRTTEICSNPGFVQEPRKNYRPELQGNLMQKQYLLGPMTRKVTRRNVWKDIANLRINDSTILQSRNTMHGDHQF